MCIPQAEPTFRAQLWRTVRTLFVAFVVLSGVGALMEERGLTKGILNNPDMRPQMEMKTRFADVKGVDEAKVGTRTDLLTELSSADPCLCNQAHNCIPCSITADQTSGSCAGRDAVQVNPPSTQPRHF